MPSSAIYATTKAAVTTHTEVLYGQLRSVEAPIGVSVLYPGPKVLRTGLLESSKRRPAQWQDETPRATPHTTVESFEARMRAAGIEPDHTPVEAVTDECLQDIRENRFWILPRSSRTDEVIQARTQSMIDRANPTYIGDV
jgi:short-subunit dehydrogenase